MSTKQDLLNEIDVLLVDREGMRSERDMAQAELADVRRVRDELREQLKQTKDDLRLRENLLDSAFVLIGEYTLQHYRSGDLRVKHA